MRNGIAEMDLSNRLTLFDPLTPDTGNYAGFAIRVRDLAATRATHGTSASERAGGLVAGPVHGNLIHFVA